MGGRVAQKLGKNVAGERLNHRGRCVVLITTRWSRLRGFLQDRYRADITHLPSLINKIGEQERIVSEKKTRKIVKTVVLLAE